jgi:hypothetical protein
MPRATLLALALVLAPGGAGAGPGAATGNGAGAAIIVRDQAALRAAPRDSAQQQAVLWQGEIVEVRAERLDYLQVYDYRRERGGFVRASQARRLDPEPGSASELLALLRFLRDSTGAEALGIGMAMAYVQAASPEAMRGADGVEALDALGTLADRLAQRASAGVPQSKAAAAALAAHLDVAAGYGVRFATYERDGRMLVCYDGDAFRRVLALPARPEQRVRAVLALTREDCADPALGPAERERLDEWRAAALDRVDSAALAGYLANRVALRRAGVWSRLAYQRARRGEPADAAAQRALAEFAAVRKAELTDDDFAEYNTAAMRVGASRWAALPAPAPPARSLRIATEPGRAGETCVSLAAAGGAALARRCSYGIVWTASASANREGNALAVAVQTGEAWLELWVFHRDARGWSVRVLPPAATMPECGYVELAGWVPGGREMLVAREARGEGKYRRAFEVVRLDTLAVARQSADAAVLGPFRRWQDPAWKAATLSVR